MIKTKHAFSVFLILSLIIFPYNITLFLFNSDLLYSIVPGWHSTFIPGQIISNGIKFLILLIVTICYWKLSKTTTKIDSKPFLTHLLLTLPAIVVGKFSLYGFSNPETLELDDFINNIKIIVILNIFISFLFLVGQVFFWKFYIQKKKSITK